MLFKDASLLLSPSYYDMVSENSFHMFILGILQIAGEEYIIRSNREEGFGRADCTMRPDKNTGKAAVVMEFKHVKGNVDEVTAEMIRIAAQEALVQIEAKGYAKEMEIEGYKSILKYGIAFNEKYCIVAIF